MKINYHTIIGTGGKVEEVRVEKFDPCCKDMSNAISGEYVAVTDLDYDGFQWTKAKVCFVATSNYPEGTFYDYKTITYCPWCCEKITTEEVGRSKLVYREVPSTKTVVDEIPVKNNK